MLHQLKIHVENDTLIMRGSPEESVGCVLRGCVVFHVKENTKVKSISLNLVGRIKIQWNERNHQHKKEFNILENDWHFLSNQKKLHTLTPNTYKYPFEYIFPGNLAESIESYSYGSVSYKLKAVVDRPAFSPNLIDRQSLRVVRQFTPPYHMSNIPMQISNEWTDKLDYKITVPKRIYSRGEQIFIDVSLFSKLNSGLHVRYLSVFLKEYTTFVLGGTASIHHTESRIIRFFRDESFPSDGLHWHKTEIMTVPHSFDSIQCDTHNQFFKIKHKLKFTMSLINKEGVISELRATMPIDITNKKAEDTEQENELPTYENAWRSALYSPLPYLDPNSPYSPADEAHPLTPHQTTPDDYFGYRPSLSRNNCFEQGAPCSLLPSYHSLDLSQSNDDLPSYE